MKYSTLISPTDLRDYAKVRGWTSVSDAPSRLYILNSTKMEYHQIIVPMDIDRPDYDDAVRIAIGNLAEEEERPFHTVEASLMEAGADTLRLGVRTNRTMEDGLPLVYAARAFQGAEKAIRAAACSEIHKQAFHPKMIRAEAQKMVEKAQMKHTETGSFVLKIACPLDSILGDSVEEQTPDLPLLLPDVLPRPFVRRAMLGMSHAVRSLISAIEADTEEKLIEEARKEGHSPLSANLCDALLAFEDQDLKVNLDFSIDWSGRYETPDKAYQSKTQIQWGYFPRIEQVSKALRPKLVAKEQEFIGLVDKLLGDFLPNDPMEGDVILDLLVDGESIKARVNLGVTHHKLAHQAYESPKPYVKITGLLSPGNQPRKLTQVTNFEIISKSKN